MSQWLGPNWGHVWVEKQNGDIAQGNANRANRRADENFYIAEENADAADKWRAHTEKLRIELDRVWDMYLNKSSEEKGQAALKDAALLEIERIDPVNKMLNSGYRQKLYDEVRKKQLAKTSDD